MDVDNEIRVVSPHVVSDAGVERAVRNFIKDHQRFSNAGITLRVKQGLVSISGTFYDPRDVLFLKHGVADIEGVIQIDIKARFAA